MKELIDEPYTVKWTKSLLNKRYQDIIVFSAMEGCPDVMFFRQTTNALLYDFYRQDRCKDKKSEVVRIIKLAAEVMKSEIAEIERNNTNYFPLDNLNENEMIDYLPDSVQLFLRELVPRRSDPKEVKLAAIGKSLV